MYMQKKYNYNRHLCKKIDKLEDFTVEYKNDPFKAIKLFIDCYKWYRDPTKNLLPADLAGETVSSVEAYVKNVIKTTVFIKEMNEFGTINEVYKEYFTSEFPARSCVEVARLPKDVLLEIEAIAVK